MVTNVRKICILALFFVTMGYSCLTYLSWNESRTPIKFKDEVSKNEDLVSSPKVSSQRILIEQEWNDKAAEDIDLAHSKNEKQASDAAKIQHDQTCSPVRNIVFVKTHKTASSSVYEIIKEHVRRHGRDTIKQEFFPTPFIGGYPGPFNPEFLINSKSELGDSHPDVIMGHLRFNKTAVERLMPPNTRYITILRDPARVMYSSFSYYYGEIHSRNMTRKRANCNNSPFVDVLGKFDVTFSNYLKIAPLRLSKSMPWYFRSMNYQSHDLGIDPTRTDQKYVYQQLRQLESSFNLIMIAEYFLESLVLLRQELCMDWSYLTNAVKNKGRYDEYEFTTADRGAIRNLNRQDYIIYNYFNQTLWRKIKEYGVEKMASDVEKIRKLPTKEQINYMRNEKNENDFEIFDEDKKPAEEDVSKYYKANEKLRLSERLVKNSKFSAEDHEIQEMAGYMIKYSGGCNF